MAVDIGAEAIDRDENAGFDVTYINVASQAVISGVITSIDIWTWNDVTGLRVGTFYKTNGDTLKCRASEAIPGTITGGSKVTKAVSIAVEIDDYIGCFYSGGLIERSSSGFAGVWYKSGEHIDPGDEEIYGTLSGDTLSLGGYIGAVGWTGKISGVTNPAKIMGVDVANIAKVKGVA